MEEWQRWAVRVVVLGMIVAVVIPNLPAEYLYPIKVRVAVQLFGWQGLANIVRDQAGERLLGQKLTKSRAAFHDFLDVLELYDAEFLSPSRAITTTADIADGVAHGVGLLASAAELYFFDDVTRPRFRRYVDADRKFLGDNPDTHYYMASLDPHKYDYEFTGCLLQETYFSLAVYESNGVGGYPSRSSSDLNDEQLSLDENRCFRVWLSQSVTSPSGEEVLLLEESYTLITRHYFEHEQTAAIDPSVEVSLSIRAVPKAGASAVEEDLDARVARKLETMTNFFHSHSTNRSTVDPAMAPSWFSLVPNVLGKPDMHQVRHGSKTGGAGAPDIAYSAGPWQLEPHQGLLIQGIVPTCRFFNIVLWNRFLQTLDYQQFPVSANRVQLGLNVADPWSTFEIVLSHTRPPRGHPYANTFWLYTEERPSGTIFIRYVLPDGVVSPSPHNGEFVPAPNATVISIA